jgi:hypothetical protein
MADLNKYISDLSGQLYLSEMDPARRARLEQLKVLGTGYKEQIGTLNAGLGIYTGGWDPNAPAPDPAVPPYGIVSDNDWEKLYLSLQKTLVGMNSDRTAVTKDNKDAEELLNKFYGASPRLIGDFQVSAKVTNVIKKNLKPFIAFLKRAEIGPYLEDSNVSPEDQEKLILALDDGSYVSKPEVLKILRHVAAVIINNPPPPNSSCPISNNDLGAIYPHFLEPKSPTAAVRDAFKNDHKKIFKFLAEKPKALEAFASKDHSGFAQSIAAGVKKNNYKDGKFALMPLDENSLNAFQKAGNKVQHVKNDMLGKLSMRHKRHPYFMDETAKPIMESLLVSQKFDMTQGLDEFLKKVEGIKGDLASSPKAIPHLEYLEKVLKDVKKTLPKEFAGALKDSRNMNGIVNAIIERAVDEGKIEEAQSALECLSMMRYGYFTSGALNAIGQEKLVLLGDPEFSFNKDNEAMQFVTKAFDKSAKMIMMLGLRGAKGLHSAWNRKSLKFKSGTASVKLMAEAKEKVGAMGPVDNALIGRLKTEAQAAKVAYEMESRSPKANERKIKKLEHDWKLAEMMLATAEQTDQATQDRKPDHKLTKKQDLMAFWNYVNDPSKSGRDLNIFRNGRRAQNKQNEVVGSTAAGQPIRKKDENFFKFQQSFYDKSISA